MSYRYFWLARDLKGTLRIWETEPVWGETMWIDPARLRERPSASWVRKMPPSWFPELKPGRKVRCKLIPE